MSPTDITGVYEYNPIFMLAAIRSEFAIIAMNTSCENFKPSQIVRTAFEPSFVVYIMGAVLLNSSVATAPPTQSPVLA